MNSKQRVNTIMDRNLIESVKKEFSTDDINNALSRAAKIAMAANMSEAIDAIIIPTQNGFDKYVKLANGDLIKITEITQTYSNFSFSESVQSGGQRIDIGRDSIYLFLKEVQDTLELTGLPVDDTFIIASDEIKIDVKNTPFKIIVRATPNRKYLRIIADASTDGSWGAGKADKRRKIVRDIYSANNQQIDKLEFTPQYHVNYTGLQRDFNLWNNGNINLPLRNVVIDAILDIMKYL